MERKIAILGYHKIGPQPPGGWESWYYVSEERFEEQLAQLREGGWEIISGEQLLRGLDDPKTLPPRSALITFDDAVRSLLGPARECLRRHNHPAVVFAPVDFIGGTNLFDNGSEPEERICGWDDLRELEQAGISVQSHGMSHVGLSELEPAKQQREIAESKVALERQLGKTIDLYAFAFGDAGRDSSATRAFLTGAGYRAAFLYGGGPVSVPTDRFRLARLAIGAATDLLQELQRTQ